MKLHPNRVPFAGVLTIVDEPSDCAPNGARGHRVILTRKAAEKALPCLIGMGVNYKASWDGHDYQMKVGVIESAELDGRELLVAGYIFGMDFPELLEAATKGWRKDRLGMSYELYKASVKDMRSEVWTLTRVTFTGAAIMVRSKAAYRKTSFVVDQRHAKLSLAAAAERNKCDEKEYEARDA